MENGRGKALPIHRRAKQVLKKLSYWHITYFSDASVMIRDVEYPNFYSPLHRFHHFYDINTSDSLANRPYFGPLLGLSARAWAQQSGLFNEHGVTVRQVACQSRAILAILNLIGLLPAQRDFSQSLRPALTIHQWRHVLAC